ncbi:hypothetical protein Droror1_Dr00001208 [Drosera rotundifolia]
MGAASSREDRLSDSSDEEEYEEEEQETTKNDAQIEPKSTKFHTPQKTTTQSPNSSSSLDDIDSRLKALNLKYNTKQGMRNAVKLYLHIGGNTPNAKWVVSEKLSNYVFVKKKSDEGSDDEGEDEGDLWVLEVGSKVRARVGPGMQLKSFGNQRRVDFMANGVWALKFFSDEEFRGFVRRYEECLFENTYGFEANESNKVKVYGKDFLGWANPEAADETMWEDAEDGFGKKGDATPVRGNEGLREEYEEVADGVGGIQSLALGALDNSFLVSGSGVQVVKNFSHGIHGKGLYVSFSDGKNYKRGVSASSAHLTPKKGLLMRAETNMMLMSPASDEKPHSRGIHQLDIETGRIVSEWKFEKDGTDITMRDITNDSKGDQLDPAGSTFLGLDDNRLCRWDMRDKHGIVQNIASASASPVLNWTQGHQFTRGTNFQCFASTGDGSIVVGSVDGKIRLYSSNSMREAKTAFPGLGSPITHVDVTYDGKWVLGTTDTYLILISTLFINMDGKTKTGFSGRMGNKIAAPRLLKLTPLDSHLAGANNKFHGGQFSWVTEQGKQERHLVATVGNFSVIWNFQQVKDSSHECYRNQQGLKSCYCYKIVLKDDSIVDSRFMHDKFAVSDSPEAPLVVATPMKVSSFSISNAR